MCTIYDMKTILRKTKYVYITYFYKLLIRLRKYHKASYGLERRYIMTFTSHISTIGKKENSQFDLICYVCA